jgi:TRAP-type C4-dicarboxylate transport system substrate-binding protein
MRADIDAEMRQNGFANLGETGFAFDFVFSRQPVRTMADLKLGRFWLWNLDPASIAVADALGIAHVTSSVDEAAKIYDSEHLDGMIAEPTAALAYQWSTLAKYFTPVGMAFLPGCMVMSNAAFDALPLAQREVIKTSVAKFLVRFSDVSETTNRALEDRLFEKQGLTKIPLSAQMRADFLRAAHEAQDRLSEQIVSKSLLARVRGWLVEQRAQSRATPK